MPEAFEEITFQNGDMRLHAVAAGNAEAPVLILLHGFPEFWFAWRHQIEPLAEAGFRVIVPDQRGYNKSSKPKSVGAYATDELVSDVIAVADQLGRKEIYLAGHDWGGVVAWSVALKHPGRIARLAILNVPHPAVLRRFLKTKPRQMRRSWYLLFFQIPWLPEALFSTRDFREGTASLVRSSRPGTFSESDLKRYKEAWTQPGAMTAMINWYRALFRKPFRFADPQLRMPTLVIWGARDAFLLPEMADESLRYCPQGELKLIPQATHWVQHEEPAQVTRLLIEFFRSGQINTGRQAKQSDR